MYTSTEYTERLRHYFKRTYDLDKKPALSGVSIPTRNRWTEHEPEVRHDLIWGAGPSAIENITKENLTHTRTLEKKPNSRTSNKKTCLSQNLSSKLPIKKLREKIIREKTLNIKTTMDLVTQDSYEKRHEQSTIPAALVREKEVKQ